MLIELAIMATSCTLFFIFGFMNGRISDVGCMTAIAAAIGLYMVFSRGYYWNLFGVGEGTFTANRISAAIVIALAFIAGTFFGTYSRLAKLRDE